LLAAAGLLLRDAAVLPAGGAAVRAAVRAGFAADLRAALVAFPAGVLRTADFFVADFFAAGFLMTDFFVDFFVAFLAAPRLDAADFADVFFVAPRFAAFLTVFLPALGLISLPSSWIRCGRVLHRRMPDALISKARLYTS